MELIEKFRNYYYEADNFVYRFENGLRVVVTLKKGIRDFHAAVLFKNGSGSEHQLEVPNGTAHFLEHLMVFSPSKFFKTPQKKREFGYGNEKYPSVDINGATSLSFMWVYSSGQIKGKARVLKMLESYLQSSREDFAAELDNQMKIIISERDRKKKEEFDATIQYYKFMLNDFYPELVKYVLGDPADISGMDLDKLMKIRDEYSKGSNAIITIQTSKWPDKSLSKKLEKLSGYFNGSNSMINYEYREFEDKFKVGHMLDPEMQDVFLSFNTLYKRDKSESDRELVFEDFGRELIWKVMHEFLREQKRLTYAVKNYVESIYTIYENKGFSTSVPFTKLAETLDCIDHVYGTFWKEFLYSDYGSKWFSGMKSDYIYKRTSNYNPTFALDRGCDILSDIQTRANYDVQIEIAKAMTKEQLEKYFVANYIDRPKKVWIKSSLKENEVMEVFNASKLYQRLSKQK